MNLVTDRYGRLHGQPAVAALSPIDERDDPMTALTHALMHDYANAFCTYGALSNPVWFLGLEEGGGNDLASVGRKLSRWSEARLETAGTVGVIHSSGLTGPECEEGNRDDEFLRVGSGKRARLQPTWANQLRVLIGMRGDAPNNDTVRHLQTREHGRIGGATCLMELFPLPCRDDGTWIYGDVPYPSEREEANVFRSKRAYREHHLPERLTTIAALVEEYRPKALVFTSWEYGEYVLSMLDDVEVPELGIAGVRRKAEIGRLHDTVVAVCTHPTAPVAGPCNAFYHALGLAIARRIPPGDEWKRAA